MTCNRSAKCQGHPRLGTFYLRALDHTQRLNLSPRFLRTAAKRALCTIVHRPILQNGLMPGGSVVNILLVYRPASRGNGSPPKRPAKSNYIPASLLIALMMDKTARRLRGRYICCLCSEQSNSIISLTHSLTHSLTFTRFSIAPVAIPFFRLFRFHLPQKFNNSPNKQLRQCSPSLFTLSPRRCWQRPWSTATTSSPS